LSAIDRLKEAHPVSDAQIGWVTRNDPRFVYDLRTARTPNCETTVIVLSDLITLILAFRNQTEEP
jgi:hypothetical protein